MIEDFLDLFVKLFLDDCRGSLRLLVIDVQQVLGERFEEAYMKTRVDV